jgi:ribose 5-phosphate isomerase B
MSSINRVFLGCDHAGFSLKERLLPLLRKELPETQFVDLGTSNDNSVDYPIFASALATKVGAGEGRGILICGSGIGMAIAANKIRGVRAAVVWDVTSANLSRRHNDANIICFGARLIGPEVALEALLVFLTTSFEGGRHQKRIDQISQMEGLLK